ncbi:ATPase [Nocardiopsis alba]|uniref:hypothetical protein n=1 Tax=Nocardiopsis alba TaxID=53437 RepID=UPI0005AB66BE|nr:hypothetical protein [Nocardiopsis alba]
MDVEQRVRPVFGDGWARRVGRLLFRPLGPVDGVARAVELGSGLQRSTVTGRRIAVDDVGTGADATVVAALMARALAHLRHDRVLVVDAETGEPSLATRLGASEPGDLGATDAAAFETVRDGLGQVTDRLWTARTDPEDGGTYASGLLPVSRFFGVTLVAGERGGGFLETMAARAHSRVRVVRATREAVVRLGRELDDVASGENAAELARTVVVLAREQDAGQDLDVTRTARIIEESGAAVIVLPPDRHLEQRIEALPDRIAESTHRLVQAVAVEALARAVDGGSSTEGGR